MSKAEIVAAHRTAQHLIVEVLNPEGALASVMPSKKIGGVTVLSGGHADVMRRVYTLVQAQEIFFKGKRLESMPGLHELFVEFVTPGEQIVSRPTGRFSVEQTYVGKRNIIKAKVVQRSVVAPSVTINYFGKDPAPKVVLHGNPSVPFVEANGELPTGAAYYNTQTGRLLPIQNPDRRTLVGNFIRMFQNAELPVG